MHDNFRNLNVSIEICKWPHVDRSCRTWLPVIQALPEEQMEIPEESCKLGIVPIRLFQHLQTLVTSFKSPSDLWNRAAYC